MPAPVQKILTSIACDYLCLEYETIIRIVCDFVVSLKLKMASITRKKMKNVTSYHILCTIAKKF